MDGRALLATALLIAASPAWAQVDAGFDAFAFVPVGQDGDPRDLAQTYRAGRFEGGEFWGTALFAFSDSPLVLVKHYDDGRPDEAEPWLDDVMALDINLGGAPLDFLKIETTVPLIVSSKGPDGSSQGFALGDIQLAVAAAILRPKPRFGGGFGLQVVPYVGFPTGDDTKFLGAGGFTFGGRVAATYEIGPLTLSADGGPHILPNHEISNGTGDELITFGPGTIKFGGGVGFLPIQSLGINVEARSSAPMGSNTFKGTAVPLELGLNVRYRLGMGLHFLLGGTMGLTQGAGAAPWRVFAAVGWGKVNFDYGDMDGDGVADEADQCQKEKEVINSYQDADGCPDEGGRGLFLVRTEGFVETDVLIRITDGTDEWKLDSGLEPIPLELVPGEYHVKAGYPGWLAEQSFEITSGDVPVTLDLQAVVPGSLSISLTHGENGSLDKVGLSIIGEGAPTGAQVLGPAGLANMDLPPGLYLVYLMSNDEAVFRKYIEIEPREHVHIDAILRSPRAVISDTRIEVSDKIYFDTGQATIKAESYDLLEEIGTLLIANPYITKVEVGGHTDDQGDENANWKLSEDRAAAVLEFLVDVGVERSRLTSVGYGEQYPIATNSTESGRATNRRVEFLILEQQ